MNRDQKHLKNSPRILTADFYLKVKLHGLIEIIDLTATVFICEGARPQTDLFIP